ncbi:MAG: DinB family protein [Chloroflexi bacterium]|nr:DinB family protein [Chloroflexota bacterium]
MNGVGVLRLALESVSRELQREIEGLTPDQFVYRPTPEANTIAFTSWHIVRMLDSATSRVLPKEPRPPLWERDGWHTRFGLEAQESGTGYDAERVGAFRPLLDVVLGYNRAVAAEIPGAFEGLTDDDLDRIPDPAQPNMNLGRRILVFSAAHTQYHLGEVRFLKGMQGMPFPR